MPGCYAQSLTAHLASGMAKRGGPSCFAQQSCLGTNRLSAVTAEAPFDPRHDNQSGIRHSEDGSSMVGGGDQLVHCPMTAMRGEFF